MDGRWRQVARVARHPHLRRLEASFGLFAIAEHGTWLAITVFAFDRGGVGEAGLVAVVQLAPAVVVAPFAAYAGDRFRKDVVLAIGYLAQSVCMLATAAAMWLDAPAVVVYGAATSAAVAVTFTRPGIGALLPAVVNDPAELTAANVSLGVLEHLGAFLGPVLAGVLIQAGGEPAHAFAVMGAGMALAAATVSHLDVDRRLMTPQEAIDAGDVVRDAMGGFSTLRTHADLRLLVTVLAISAVLCGAADVLFVAVADDLFDESTPARAGVLGSSFGLGTLGGAIASVAFVGRSRLVVPLAGAVAASGVALALIGTMSHFAPVVVLFMVAGAGESVSRIAGSCLVQRVTPAAVLSRVFGVLEGLQMAALAIGAAVISLLVNELGLRSGLVIMGVSAPVLLLARASRLLAIDAAAPSPRPALVELLTANPIFAHLPAPTLERLLAETESHALDAGVVVVRQGDEGDRYYLVETGELEVVVDGTRARVLGPGSGFGEVALVRDVPRTATVTTRTPAVLHSVRRAEFLEALSGRPAAARVAREHAQRLLDEDASRARREPPDR
jgi:MFS family permease